MVTHLDDRTDEELARRARVEPRAAFEVLFDRHRGAIWNFILRQGLDVARAEDLCQTTFLKAWRAIPSFREEARFKTWLYAIAVNVVADERRTAFRRERPLPLEEAALTDRGAMEDRENRADAAERVRIALSRFPADERQLFTLVPFHLRLSRGVPSSKRASLRRARTARSLTATRVEPIAVAVSAIE